MCSTSVFSCIMAMVSNFTTIFIRRMFTTKQFLQMWQFVWLRYESYYLLINDIIFFFSKLIIFIACFLKDSQNLFVWSLTLYTSCLFSIQSNVHIVGIVISTRNMFTYFCCGWFLRFIFKAIYFFNLKF